MVLMFESTHPCSISFINSVILSIIPFIYLMKTALKAAV